MSATHIGQVFTFNLSLLDTFLILNLILSLISVGQVCAIGMDFYFSRHGCCVQDPKIGRSLVGRWFELTLLHLPAQFLQPSHSHAYISGTLP